MHTAEENRTMNDRIRIAFIDDHAILRDALEARIEHEQDLELVGTADNAGDGLEMVRRVKPQMIIMDIDMPGASAFDVAKQIKSEMPEVKLMFLSAYAHDRYVDKALSVGASGYMTKGTGFDKLVAGIREVAAGNLCFDRVVEDRLIFESGGARLAKAPMTRGATLTERQESILRLIAQGLAKKEIASELGISVKTVETHTENLMAKLGIHDRVELTRYAIREGYTQP